MLRKDIANENLKSIKIKYMEFENKPEFLKNFFSGFADLRSSDKC